MGKKGGMVVERCGTVVIFLLYDSVRTGGVMYSDRYSIKHDYQASSQYKAGVSLRSPVMGTEGAELCYRIK